MKQAANGMWTLHDHEGTCRGVYIRKFNGELYTEDEAWLKASEYNIDWQDPDIWLFSTGIDYALRLVPRDGSAKFWLELIVADPELRGQWRAGFWTSGPNRFEGIDPDPAMAVCLAWFKWKGVDIDAL